MSRRIANCTFACLLGYIVTKGQDAVGVSFRRSRPAAEETYMYTAYEIEDDQGIVSMLVDIRQEQLFTVNDLSKCQSTLGERKTISKNLCGKMLYVGQINGCQKILIYMQSTAQKKISRS